MGQGVTESQARKLVADIYALVNQDALPSSTVKDFLEFWPKRKEIETGEHTHLRYNSRTIPGIPWARPKFRRVGHHW